MASSPIARPRGTTDKRRTTTTNSSSSHNHDSAPSRPHLLICTGEEPINPVHCPRKLPAWLWPPETRSFFCHLGRGFSSVSMAVAVHVQCQSQWTIEACILALPVVASVSDTDVAVRVQCQSQWTVQASVLALPVCKATSFLCVARQRRDCTITWSHLPQAVVVAVNSKDGALCAHKNAPWLVKACSCTYPVCVALLSVAFNGRDCATAQGDLAQRVIVGATRRSRFWSSA